MSAEKLRLAENWNNESDGEIEQSILNDLQLKLICQMIHILQWSHQIYYAMNNGQQNFGDILTILQNYIILVKRMIV